MALTAAQINSNYLAKMYAATEEKDKVLHRIREFWWPHFVADFDNDPRKTIDTLDLCMDEGQEHLRRVATEYAANLGFDPGTPAHTQRVSQVLKSNTGKMFERFIALSVAHTLEKFESSYCVWSFTNDLKNITSAFKKDDLKVSISLGKATYTTHIDADFVIFNPNDKDGPYFLVSIKSTLKDRFHNVPFWNLLRYASLGEEVETLKPANAAAVSRPYYIVICSDLAEEQPDFSADCGPRNLLCLDAALLDGAYVTASRAVGLGTSAAHLGLERESAFYPLSRLMDMLCPNYPAAAI